MDKKLTTKEFLQQMKEQGIESEKNQNPAEQPKAALTQELIKQILEKIGVLEDNGGVLYRNNEKLVRNMKQMTEAINTQHKHNSDKDFSIRVWLLILTVFTALLTLLIIFKLFIYG